MQSDLTASAVETLSLQRTRDVGGGAGVVFCFKEESSGLHLVLGQAGSAQQCSLPGFLPGERLQHC